MVRTPAGRSPGTRRALRGRSRVPVARTTARAGSMRAGRPARPGRPTSASWPSHGRRAGHRSSTPARSRLGRSGGGRRPDRRARGEGRAARSRCGPCAGGSLRAPARVRRRPPVRRRGGARSMAARQTGRAAARRRATSITVPARPARAGERPVASAARPSTAAEQAKPWHRPVSARVRRRTPSRSSGGDRVRRRRCVDLVGRSPARSGRRSGRRPGTGGGTPRPGWASRTATSSSASFGAQLRARPRPGSPSASSAIAIDAVSPVERMPPRHT